jgi:precorrin-6B methylase 2
VSAIERWRGSLEAWTIPDAILAAASESPYGFPTELFRRRAVRSASAPPTPTTVRASEALPPKGTVLDVGVGGGSTSLPLAGRASSIVGVDSSPAMLSAFGSALWAAFGEAAAGSVSRLRTIEGSWPECALEAPVCDVVVCGHVLYNVADIEPFVRGLDAHATARIVVELTGEHPWMWMNDLWMRFHDLERPTSPTAEDARDVLEELRFGPGWEERSVGPQPSGFERRQDAVALVRRRLCLPPDADAAVEVALGDRLRSDEGLWSAGPSTTRIVTMWWDAGRR